jgi:hypothetical protein
MGHHTTDEKEEERKTPQLVFKFERFRTISEELRTD